MNGKETDHSINIDGSQVINRLLNDYIRQKRNQETKIKEGKMLGVRIKIVLFASWLFPCACAPPGFLDK